MKALKRPLLDCATRTILCSLPSTNSSIQNCLKTHVCKYLRRKRLQTIVLPFRDQKSANAVSKQLGDLSVKVSVDISLMYSRKIKDEIKVREDRPPLVNQQCIVYHLNVTCVMRVIRVIHADTYTNKLRKTKNQK